MDLNSCTYSFPWNGLLLYWEVIGHSSVPIPSNQEILGLIGIWVLAQRLLFLNTFPFLRIGQGFPMVRQPGLS